MSNIEPPSASSFSGSSSTSLFDFGVPGQNWFRSKLNVLLDFLPSFDSLSLLSPDDSFLAAFLCSLLSLWDLAISFFNPILISCLNSFIFSFASASFIRMHSFS
uniref:Uncharacterized protein n=1 Tax=Opuntia streptacantha TaxID=393608 RepID=A0A7C8ZJ68_OPUST